MPLRAAITKGRILEFELDNQKSKVPPLIWHVVFCNGRGRWRGSLDVFQRLPSSVRELARWALTAPPQLIQLIDPLHERRSGCPEQLFAVIRHERSEEGPPPSPELWTQVSRIRLKASA